jgi:hypothetical protein
VYGFGELDMGGIFGFKIEFYKLYTTPPFDPKIRLFSVFLFIILIVNKALNLIGGRVPSCCVAWDALGRNPRSKLYKNVSSLFW